MANSTEDESPTFVNQEFSCVSGVTLAHRIILLMFGIPLSISAVVGNVLIIVVLHKLSSLHPPSKLLLACLAFTDLSVGLIAHPLLCGLLFPPKRPSSCSRLLIVLNTSFLFSGVSLSTMTAISVDRLLALLLGLRYRQVVTVRRVKISIVALWILCSSVVMIVIYGNRSMAFGISSAGFVMCIVISTFCYTKIYRTLRLSQVQVQDQSHQGQPNEEGTPLNKERYKKTVSTALWVQITLLACYVPFGLVSVFVITASRTPSIVFAWLLSITLLYFNSTLNPLLYCWKMRELRQEMKNAIRKIWCISDLSVRVHNTNEPHTWIAVEQI